MKSIAIKENTICLPNLPASFDDYRIIQISDLHLGRGKDQSESILGTLESQNCDLLVLTGDTVHAEDHPYDLDDFLSKLNTAAKANDGLFGVFGNHDRSISRHTIQNSPVRWLCNDSVQIKRGEDTISLIGLDQQNRSSSNYMKAIKNISADDIKITIAHYPSTAYLLNGVVDLVIAGHCHGGQARIPGIPFMTNDDIDCKNAKCQSHIGKTQLVVSVGVGYSGPASIRLFASPEIGVITLKRTI